jgi:hypothetical protein
MATPIGTLGTIPSITVGGRVFTDLTSLKVLSSGVITNPRCTFRLPTGSAGYQVTAGTTLTVSAIRIVPSTTGLSVCTLAQTDNDVGLDSATAFTNPVYQGGSTTIWTHAISSTIPTAVEATATLFTVAAQKYLSSLGNTNGERYIAFGYEA